MSEKEAKTSYRGLYSLLITLILGCYFHHILIFNIYFEFQNNFPDFLISEYVENIGLSEAYVGPLQYLRWGSL